MPRNSGGLEPHSVEPGLLGGLPLMLQEAAEEVLRYMLFAPES